MAIWPWYGALALGRSYPDAETFLSVHEYTHVTDWAKRIDARPAVNRGRRVNRISDEPGRYLRERHGASDFDGIA
jgi:GST-like protein